MNPVVGHYWKNSTEYTREVQSLLKQVLMQVSRNCSRLFDTEHFLVASKLDVKSMYQIESNLSHCSHCSNPSFLLLVW